MPGQAQQQQALQGQLGGLDSSRAQRTPQQNPNMPTLNRPLNPPSQAQTPQRQVQNTPANGARDITGAQQTAAPNGQPGVGQQPGSAQKSVTPTQVTIEDLHVQSRCLLPRNFTTLSNIFMTSSHLAPNSKMPNVRSSQSQSRTANGDAFSYKLPVVEDYESDPRRSTLSHWCRGAGKRKGKRKQSLNDTRYTI